jgi:hypothetical protein
MSTDLEVESTVNWIPADKDYELAIEGKKLVCKNPKGKQLASLPKWLRESELAVEMKSLVDWLGEHNLECQATVEMWMLRSLPVPRTAMVSVWDDPSWSGALQNLVVCPLDKKDNPIPDQSGFLRGVDAKKGVGIVDLDGETQWLKVDRVMIPHPILLKELDDFRELATELGFKQVIDQLFRETWAADPEKAEESSISEFSEGKFEALNHALGLCRRLGYRVRGGSATCPVWENGTLTEGRFWVGSDDPEYETHTGDLVFTDKMEKSVPLGKVGPVAYSEGMRMASAIYAKRVVKTDDDED